MNNSPRLQKLMSDNIVDFNTFAQNYQLSNPTKVFNQEKLKKLYKYYTRPTEFSSQLHPLVLEQRKQGKSGVFNYKTVNELTEDIQKASKSEGRNSLQTIYNYIIKDKDKFRNALNKYGYFTIPAVISGLDSLKQ